MLAASYASVEYVPGTVPLISSYCVANSAMAWSSAASEAKKHGQLEDRALGGVAGGVDEAGVERTVTGDERWRRRPRRPAAS